MGSRDDEWRATAPAHTTTRRLVWCLALRRGGHSKSVKQGLRRAVSLLHGCTRRTSSSSRSTLATRSVRPGGLSTRLGQAPDFLAIAGTASVSYAHLQWKQEPRVRTVTSFPSTSSSTGSASTSGGKGSGGGGGGTRCPSAITYSLREQPLAFGSECARQEHLKVAHESGWTTVRAWKRLLLEPDSTEKGNAPSGQEDKQGSPASSTRKLVKKRLNVFGTKSASKGEQDGA